MVFTIEMKMTNKTAIVNFPILFNMLINIFFFKKILYTKENENIIVV